MAYKCAICGEAIGDDIKHYMKHTEEHIVAVIKKKHPEWVEKDGVCRKCLEYYRGQIKGPSDK